MSGVFVGVSAAENARFTSFWASLVTLEHGPVPMGVSVASGANIAENRNNLTTRFLASSADYLLYLDDDQRLLPDTLTRLLSHKKDVVSGVYLSRDYPFLPLVYDREQADGKVAKRECRAEDEGLIQVKATGAGCLLVHRRVFDALFQPYWTLGQIAPASWSDDIDFCRRVRAAGFNIWCDLDTRVGHTSQCTLWPERTARGWGATIVTGNKPVCHLAPPVSEEQSV